MKALERVHALVLHDFQRRGEIPVGDRGATLERGLELLEARDVLRGIELRLEIDNARGREADHGLNELKDVVRAGLLHELRAKAVGPTAGPRAVAEFLEGLFLRVEHLKAIAELRRELERLKRDMKMYKKKKKFRKKRR